MSTLSTADMMAAIEALLTIILDELANCSFDQVTGSLPDKRLAQTRFSSSMLCTTEKRTMSTVYRGRAMEKKYHNQETEDLLAGCVR
jgi:hypothetical protein